MKMDWNPITIDADFGNFQCDTPIQFYKAMIAQLQYYLDLKASPDEAYTRSQLAAYVELVATGSEATAFAFSRRKAVLSAGMIRQADNWVVIELLKGEGIWPN